MSRCTCCGTSATTTTAPTSGCASWPPKPSRQCLHDQTPDCHSSQPSRGQSQSATRPRDLPAAVINDDPFPEQDQGRPVEAVRITVSLSQLVLTQKWNRACSGNGL